MTDQHVPEVNPQNQFQLRFIYLVFGVLAVVMLFYNPLVDVAVAYNNEVATGALVIWGTVRAILGVVAVVMDGDVSGSIGIASTTVSPGAVLKPIANMIVRFVDWLFVLMLVSNILAALLPAAAKVGATLLACGLFAIAGFGFFQRSFHIPEWLFSFARAGVIAGAFFAIIVPASYTLSFQVGDQMTTDAWNDATAVMDDITAQVDSVEVAEIPVSGGDVQNVAEGPTKEAGVGTDEDTEEQGILSSTLGGISSGMATAVDVTKNAAGAVAGVANNLRDSVSENTLGLVSAIISAAEDLTNAFIQVLVALLLKLIVLPVLIIGAAHLVGRYVVRKVGVHQLEVLRLK